MATPAPGASVGLLVFLAVGALGGAHCLGMCGPLVTLYADRLADRTPDGGDRLHPTEVRQHLLFNAGRVLGYALLGAAFGALGLAVFDAAAVAAVADDVRAVTGVAAGTAIILAGVGYLRSGRGPTVPSLPLVGDLFARVAGALTARVDAWVGGPRIVALGAVHGLLPCPILYPAFLYAFALGSPVRGALSLAVLGLGTVPTLLAYGTLFGSLDAGTRLRLHRALGVAFVALGYIPLAHGLGLVGVDLPAPALPVHQPLDP